MDVINVWGGVAVQANLEDIYFNHSMFEEMAEKVQCLKAKFKETKEAAMAK